MNLERLLQILCDAGIGIFNDRSSHTSDLDIRHSRNNSNLQEPAAVLAP
jgi:hypothetical protein